MTSSPVLIASTYCLVARELAPNPLLSLYPDGTVTGPVPFGASSRLPLLFVVDTIFPSIVMLSTSTLVYPLRSVLDPPSATASEPMVI